METTKKVRYQNDYLTTVPTRKKKKAPKEKVEEAKEETLEGLLKDHYQKEEEENESSCSNCQGSNCFFEDLELGAVICERCGTAQNSILDFGAEWRNYNNDDSRGGGSSRASCMVNPFFTASSEGTTLSGAMAANLRRKQKWNNSSYHDRRLNEDFQMIVKICQSLELPGTVVESAKIFFHKIRGFKKDGGGRVIVRGKNRDSIMAACIQKACETNQHVIKIGDLASVFLLTEKKLTRGRKKFQDIIKVIEGGDLIDNLPSITVADYLRNGSEKLELDKKIESRLQTVAANCIKLRQAADHNIETFSAGVIFAVSEYYRLRISKEAIAQVFDTSPATIGKVYAKINPYIEYFLDDVKTEYIHREILISLQN